MDTRNIGKFKFSFSGVVLENNLVLLSGAVNPDSRGVQVLEGYYRDKVDRMLSGTVGNMIGSTND